MNQSWVDATRINRTTGTEGGAVDHTAHPLLDPNFDKKGSRLLYLIRMTFRRIVRSDQAYRRELARLFYPSLTDFDQAPELADLRKRTTEYLSEADIYLASTIDLLPTANGVGAGRRSGVSDRGACGKMFRRYTLPFSASCSVSCHLQPRKFRGHFWAGPRTH